MSPWYHVVGLDLEFFYYYLGGVVVIGHADAPEYHWEILYHHHDKENLKRK
jgi:hypothetical protein